MIFQGRRNSCLHPAHKHSLHLKHRFRHQIHSSYRGNYSTATISLEPHLALTQKLEHQPHPQAPHSAGTVSTQSLPRSIWSRQTDGEAAPPPAARAPAGFSPTPSGSGQLSPSQKQSLETTTEASSRLKLTRPQARPSSHSWGEAAPEGRRLQVQGGHCAEKDPTSHGLPSAAGSD